MTSFNQNKFSKSNQTNSSYVSIPNESDLTTFKVDSLLNQLTKGKEAIRCEKIGLLEDKCVQSIFKDNPLPNN